MKNIRQSLLLGCLWLLAAGAQAQGKNAKPGPAPTPPMGWNSYNCFGASGLCAWVSKNSNSSELNLALFNLTETPQAVTVLLTDLGLKKGKYRVRDLWEKTDLSEVTEEVSPPVNPHGARLFRISKK